MQNELARVGTIIYNMRHNVMPNQELEQFELLHAEFDRISICLSVELFKELPELPYLLEFHRSEAMRLLRQVEQMYEYIEEMGTLIANHNFIGRMYLEFRARLVELAYRIDQMMPEKIGGKPCKLINWQVELINVEQTNEVNENRK